MNTSELLAEHLDRIRRWTVSLLEDLSEEDWLWPPGPNLGQIAWQVGHIAVAEHGLILVRCAQQPVLEESFLSLFRPGSTPSSGAEGYPSIAELRDKMDSIHQRALQIVRQLDDSDLQTEPAGKPHPMFTTKTGAIQMAASHEAFHAGQIALIRRLRGKPALR